MKITLSFKSSQFSTWPKSKDKSLNILKTKKCFQGEIKRIFYLFKGLSVVKNYPFKDKVTVTCLQNTKMIRLVHLKN